MGIPRRRALLGLHSRDLVEVVAIGGVLGWLGAGRLTELSVVNRPLGGRAARYGPAKNANLAFLPVGRGRKHAGLLSRRSHARRDVIDLTEDLSVKVTLDAGEQRVGWALRFAPEGRPWLAGTHGGGRWSSTHRRGNS